MRRPEVVVIGASAGGLAALEKILESLSPEIITPILICQHLGPDSGDSVMKLLKKHSVIELLEPNDKELILDSHIYIAPANYHMVVEVDRSISVTIGPKVNYCRPSIDVLFDSASEAFLGKTLGILLTGANSDGSEGFKSIKSAGGVTIAQDPEDAEVETMPMSAIKRGLVDIILPLDKIIELLNRVLVEDCR